MVVTFTTTMKNSISETDDYIRQSSTTDGHKLSNGIAHSPQPEQPLPQIQDSKPSFLKGLPKVLPDIQLKTDALPTSQSSSVPVPGVNLMSKLSEITQMNQAHCLRERNLYLKSLGFYCYCAKMCFIVIYFRSKFILFLSYFLLLFSFNIN